ncbi:MAG: tRNA threonylcarbamoyladenosine dehydratase [Lentisphaeria bacterium]
MMQNTYIPHSDAAFSRTELLLGTTALEHLGQAHILLCGIGGVGSWAAEILVRSNIKHLTIIDPDTVKASNINRQLPALHSTIGETKGIVLKQRLHDISPQAEITFSPTRLTPENIPDILAQQSWDYIIDAIDERPPKLALIQQAIQQHIPIISSMGSANKIIPSAIQIADISDTYGCSMAKLLRKNLKKVGITKGLKVVFSPELSILLANGKYCGTNQEEPGEKRPLGTISYMPALFGLYCASEVIQDLLKKLPPLPRKGNETPKGKKEKINTASC